ncbi:hypothetical protein [Streptodolium elevatio]
MRYEQQQNGHILRRLRYALEGRLQTGAQTGVQDGEEGREEGADHLGRARLGPPGTTGVREADADEGRSAASPDEPARDDRYGTATGKPFR